MIVSASATLAVSTQNTSPRWSAVSVNAKVPACSKETGTDEMVAGTGFEPVTSGLRARQRHMQDETEGETDGDFPASRVIKMSNYRLKETRVPLAYSI